MLQEISFHNQPEMLKNLLENTTIAFSNMVNLKDHWCEKFDWSVNNKSRLIEKLLLGIPLNPIILETKKDNTVEIITSWKELYTLYEFTQGKFKLTGISFFSDLNSKTYFNMPKNIRRHLEETYLPIYVMHANANASEEDIYDFKSKLY